MSEAKHQTWWAVIGLGSIAGIGGGLIGTFVGIIPGFLAARGSPGGYFGLFFDSFLSIVTFCAIAGALIFSTILGCIMFSSHREKRIFLAMIGVALPLGAWLFLTVLVGGFEPYRIYGWFFGAAPGFFGLLIPALIPNAMDPHRRRASFNGEASALPTNSE